jgi:hypothetical protein
MVIGSNGAWLAVAAAEKTSVPRRPESESIRVNEPVDFRVERACRRRGSRDWPAVPCEGWGLVLESAVQVVVVAQRFVREFGLSSSPLGRG